MGKLRDERGSIAITLVFIILAGAAMLVVAAYIVQGQSLSGRDVAREQSLRAAEVGLDRAVALVRASPTGDPAAVSVASWTAVSSGSSYEYKVSAVKTTDVSSGLPSWTVDAYGRRSDGQGQRHIQRIVTTSPLAQVGIFARISLIMNGSSMVDSYDSSLPDGNQVDRSKGGNLAVMAKETGNGRVATEGLVDLRGNTSPAVDGVDLYYAKQAWLPSGISQLPGATGDCLGPKCDQMNITGHADQLPDPSIALCANQPYSDAYLGKLQYGINSFRDTDIVISDSSLPAVMPSPLGTPVILCAKGKITFDGHSNGVNMYNAATAGGPADWRPRPGTSFFVFLNQSSGAQPTLEFNNHCEFAGVIFAPAASFDKGTQCDFYGAVYVNSLGTTGGLGVHYDDALARTTLSMPVHVGAWVEK